MLHLSTDGTPDSVHLQVLDVAFHYVSHLPDMYLAGGRERGGEVMQTKIVIAYLVDIAR